MAIFGFLNALPLFSHFSDHICRLSAPYHEIIIIILFIFKSCFHLVSIFCEIALNIISMVGKVKGGSY